MKNTTEEEAIAWRSQWGYHYCMKCRWSWANQTGEPYFFAKKEIGKLVDKTCAWCRKRLADAPRD